MKNLFFLILAITTNIQLKAQNYIPMAVEQAQWTIFVSDDDGFPPFDEYYYGYRIEGDTIINAITYKKIYRRSFASVNPDLNEPLVGPYVVSNEYIYGAIRDDLSNKKVYAIQFCEIPPNDCGCNTEFLIYDFSMNVGDFYTDFCLYEIGNILYVGEIITQNIFNQNRYVQKIYDDTGDTLIFRIYEGIGSNSGLFESFCYFECDTTFDLANFCIGSDEECLSDFVTLSLNENSLENIFTIYPNPVKENLTIKSSLKFKSIKIYDMLGKELITTTNNTIKTTGFKKGIYTIIITIENGQKIVEKFIKS